MPLREHLLELRSRLVKSGIAIVLGLGLYQRLSAEVEEQVEARDKAVEANGEHK